MPWPSWRASTTCALSRVSTGLRRSLLRYFNVFGPYQDPTSHYSGVLAIFCRKMLAGEQPTIFGDGEQSRDFTYIENVVQGNLLAAAAPADKVSGRVMNTATGSAVTLNQTFEILRGLTGYRGKPAYAEPRQGDIRNSLADIRLARRAAWVYAAGGLPGRAAPYGGAVSPRCVKSSRGVSACQNNHFRLRFLM